ncbi:hypothetical protein C9374_002079 [Naegleria lovaniensis]|uniref:Peptidase M28 domain-containing protein n=1 Tax=Naegleria lovaniensis TaxID=51637 RepID=A0AA88GVS3_NAELO|nr:uncharacterized protein C9374_002079 [Naegleria lovaniensis]KAG2387044.1 hypothetical protein C9374_002079 [Naegleria lovaniensis]
MTPNNDDHTQQPSAKLSESVRSTTSNKKHHHEHSTHHSTQLKFVFTYQNQQIVIYDKQIRSLIFWLVIIFLHLSILILVYYRQQVPNFSSSASSLKLSEFSSQRCIAEARKFYNSSEAFFGRIVGSEEYRKSLQFLGNQLEQLKAKNDKFQNHLEMTIDFHYVKDGQATFSMRHPAHIFPNMKITLSYSNVTNILVRLHSKKHLQFLNESILVSSHFDSVPSTQSVSGTIPTFIALEMISNLIHDPDTIRHPVIFIFNSAKEIGLIGSKIFVTRHPWASTVRSVINMESIGSGASRDLTFQSTNTWVMKQFASVCKYPKATAVAQDFFSLGLIPSQSDFNVYTSYLNLTIGGIDSVFYRNGYVHHTNRDTIHTLNENTIQHMGENLVPFIKKLASFPTFFPNPVYNVIILIALTFMVRKIYSKEKEKKENRKKRRRRVSNASHELTATTSTSEDVTTSENSEIMTRNIHDEDERYIWSLLKAFGIVLLSLISSMLFPSLVALTLAFIFKNPMSWYATGSVFTLFLFAFPSILGITLVLAIFSSYTSSFYIYVSVWLFWVLVTLVFNWFNIVSGFLPVVVVLALVIASSHTIQKYTKWYIHLTIMMTGYLIFVLEHILIAVDIFVPIMSRSGFVNSIWKCDVSIACFIGFIAFLATNLLYPFVISENQRKSQIANSNKLHLVIFLSVSLVLMIFSGLMLAPYSEAAPKRVLVQKVIVLPDEDFDTSMAIGVRKGGISEILHLSNDLDMNMESHHVPVQYVMNGNLGALQTILTNSKEHEIYLIPALAIQQVTSIDYDSFIAIDFNSSSISSDSPQPSSYLRENPVKTLTFGSKNNVTIILESDMLVLSQEIRLYLKPEHVVSSSIDNMQHRGEFLSFFHLYASSRGDFSKILQFNILLASHAPRQFHLQILSHYTQSESTNFLFNSEILPFTAELLPNTFISPIYTIVTDTMKTIKLR